MNGKVEEGSIVSEYILTEKIGQGGFGEVWKAKHKIIPEKIVAVKIPTNTDALDELESEGILQYKLDHPNIIKTLGLDTTADPPYFIMEFVDGKCLKDIIKEKGKLKLEEGVDISIQTLNALAYAHKHNVIHRDIKPHNIIIDKEGTVKIADFGLGELKETKVSEDEIELSGEIKKEDAVSGTLEYMSPEQMQPDAEVDTRTDLYSFGILFFEILTGKRPHGHDMPSDLNEDIPKGIDEIFSKCYCSVEKRYQNAEEILEDLKKYLELDYVEDLEVIEGRESGALVDKDLKKKKYIFCEKCGTANPPNSLFCFECGLKFKN